MKKTFPVNINGKVFYIDEDAYELLQNYLCQLKSAFTGPEGEEIISDIESRISELFDERISQGAHAIIYTDVNQIIEIMGKPSDISGDESNDDTAMTDGDELNTPETNVGETSNETDTDKPVVRRLYRSESDKILGGVLGGLATYLGWDATIMRILFALLTVFTQVWPLTLVYLIAWMVIPPANTPRRILEQNGQPVTVDTVSQTVLSSTTPPPYMGNVARRSSNVFLGILRFIGKCVIGLVGLTGAAVVIVATGFGLFFLTALISFYIFGSTTLLFETWRYYETPLSAIISTWAGMNFALCCILPGLALAVGAMKVLFNSKGVAKSTVIFSIILEIILIVSTIVLFIYAETLR